MRILLAEKSSFSEVGIKALAEIASLDALDLTQTGLQEAVGAYQVLVVRLGLQVNAAVLAAGRQLQVIGSPTTGLDHIDLAEASRRNIPVLSLKGERLFLDQVYATAEHTLALLLSLVRHIPSAFESVKEYRWRRDLYRGTELGGKTLGILGCGRLGSMVAGYALAFGMRVLAYDPYVAALPAGVERCDDLDSLLARSDILSVHVPLNDETRGMLSIARLSRLRRGAILVNTARGGIVDEPALLNALESGQLRGAALDVLQDELRLDQNTPNPLIEYARTHDNLIITPHVGGATQESVEKADLFLVRKISHFLSNNTQP